MPDTVTLETDGIPNGHARSFRRGIAAALNDAANDQPPDDLPNGHNRSYGRGFAIGTALHRMVAENERD